MRRRRSLRLPALAVGLALLGPAPVRGQAISADSVRALEARKLQLEVEQLENREALSGLVRNRTWGRVVGVLDSPLVSTLITLGVGGLLFSVLADRRARRGHNLDKAIEVLDRVAGDLNGVLTTLFGYIRRGNITDYDPPVAPAELVAGRRRTAAKLEGKIPDLYGKRFAIALQSQAFIGSARRGGAGGAPPDFASRYRLLVWHLEMLVRITGQVYANPQGHGQEAEIRERRAALVREWPLESDVAPRRLTPPFNELNQWAEEVAARSVDLVTSTLRHLLRRG